MEGTQLRPPRRFQKPESAVLDSARGQLRVGLILKTELLERDLYTSMLTSYLVRGILERFDCRIISTQREYEDRLNEVDAMLSLEPKFAAPLLNWRGGFLGWGAREPRLSYVICSDSHMRKWRQSYFLKNQISFMLSLYHAPFRYNFRRIPEERLVHFPWAVPDAMFYDGPIVCRNQPTLCCFGAVNGDAYNVRNWCKSRDYVESFAFSGVENKSLGDDQYMQWLAGFDAVIAAGSDLPQYDLTTPKYFEIAAAGCLLFAQKTSDLDRLGFRHMENCVVFDKETFEAEAKRYLAHPEDYLGIREAGRRLARQRHRLSVRLDFLEQHMRGHVDERKSAA